MKTLKQILFIIVMIVFTSCSSTLAQVQDKSIIDKKQSIVIEKEQAQQPFKYSTDINIPELNVNRIRSSYENMYYELHKISYEYYDKMLSQIIEAQQSINKKLSNELQSMKFDVATLIELNGMQAEQIQILQNKYDGLRRVDSMKIAILEQRIRNVQTFVNDSIQIMVTAVNSQPADTIVDEPIIPANLIKDVVSTGDSWSVVKDSVDAYLYSAEKNYQYLRFSLHDSLKVGKQYAIQWSIQSVDDTKDALMNLWAYAHDSVTITSPKISNDIFWTSGDFKYVFTVTEKSRDEIAFRARNNDTNAGRFIMWNMSCTEVKEDE